MFLREGLKTKITISMEGYTLIKFSPMIFLILKSNKIVLFVTRESNKIRPLQTVPL